MDFGWLSDVSFDPCRHLPNHCTPQIVVADAAETRGFRPAAENAI